MRPIRSTMSHHAQHGICCLLLLFVIGCLLPTPAVRADEPATPPDLVRIDRAHRSVTFAGVVTAEAWARQAAADPKKSNFDPDHWHLIISATQANLAVGRVPVIAAWATDEEIAAALAAIGAAGKDFDKRSFTRRMDVDSPYPDLRPQGTPIRVSVTWDGFFGSKTVEADDFLVNSGGSKLDLVYIGKQHPSHCIVCLYGCIGAVCPNRALTVRDYLEGKNRWSLRSGVLPDDGTRVWITLSLGS